MKTSPLYTLNLQDAVKGLVVAIGGGVISAIQADLLRGKILKKATCASESL
jgi:hypothetical protein